MPAGYLYGSAQSESRPAAAQEMSAEPAENAVAVVETMKERRLRTLELYTKRQLIHQKDGDPHIG